MNTYWIYKLSKRKLYGPVDLSILKEALRSSQLSWVDLVQSTQSANWQRAYEIKELIESLAPLPDSKTLNTLQESLKLH